MIGAAALAVLMIGARSDGSRRRPRRHIRRHDEQPRSGRRLRTTLNGLSAVEIAPEMVEVDGEPVGAVMPVDPTEVFVSLVVDDGPAVPANVVGAGARSGIELVRNIDAGTQISIRTPSGMQPRSPAIHAPPSPASPASSPARRR